MNTNDDDDDDGNVKCQETNSRLLYGTGVSGLIVVNVGRDLSLVFCVAVVKLISRKTEQRQNSEAVICLLCSSDNT